MGRAAVLVYGIISYLIFFVSFLYSIGFVGNFAVPKTIDTGTSAAMGTTLVVNLLLLGLFGVQHSLMARVFFKEWLTNFMPAEAVRSTYVLFSSLVLLLLFWQWIPMTGTVWDVSGTVGEPILLGIFALGWLLVLVSTFMIDHFDLFGLKQVIFYFNSWTYEPPDFQVPYLYRYIRHPIMLGFTIAFWATPTMSVGHLLFAAVTTAYILVGIFFEENALLQEHGEKYQNYREQVPMLLPIPGLAYEEEPRSIDNKT